MTVKERRGGKVCGDAGDERGQEEEEKGREVEGNIASII